MDPSQCVGCHPEQHRQWSGSMHAYASDDPVFLALDALGQRETGGALGDFCIGCHAPLAARLGLATSAADLAGVPRALRGVGCFFCHQIDGVVADHNGGVSLAMDDVMRGGIRDPIATNAHRSGYLPLHDGARAESAAMCGPCHDVVSPAGVHLERTYAEWRESIFGSGDPGGLSCAACHLPGRTGRAAEVPGAPVRRIHDHAMPGLDMALGAWPEQAAQRAAIERDLAGVLATELCVQPYPGGIEIVVTLDNLLAGHAFPSGVTHARRVWVEVTAARGDEIVFASGHVAAGQPVATAAQPDTWILRSRMFDAAGEEVHASWRAAALESDLLSPPVTRDPSDPRYYHARSRTYVVDDAPGEASIDRVSMQVHVRPLGLELLDELIAEDLLDAEIRARVPTFTVAAATRQWRGTDGFGCVSR